MIALKTVDLRNDFKKVSDLVNSGEKVLISRPRNENLVVISESEYNKMEKLRKTKYTTIQEDSPLQVAEGLSVSFTIEEIDEMGNLTGEEIKSMIVKKQNATYADMHKPKRTLGFVKGVPPLPESFFDPLPEEELQLWGL